MKKEKADEIITEYLPKIFGFCMKKAFSYEEAEELSSDIVEEVYLSNLWFWISYMKTELSDH